MNKKFNMENVKRKPNWSEKEKLMLVKEVNDREGRLFGKFSGVGAKVRDCKHPVPAIYINDNNLQVRYYI
jgi:hypothetical protein